MSDLKEVIAELVRLGDTQPEIAAACHCSQAAISLIATGRTKDPRDSLGQALRKRLAAKRLEAVDGQAPADPPTGAGEGTPATAG